MYLMYNDEEAMPDCIKEKPPSTTHGHTKGTVNISKTFGQLKKNILLKGYLLHFIRYT